MQMNGDDGERFRMPGASLTSASPWIQMTKTAHVHPVAAVGVASSTVEDWDPVLLARIKNVID
jgi:hypothetical protein